MKSPRLSLLLVNYNTVDLLRNCINSIVKEGGLSSKDYEIIIVDNGSTDGSREYLEQLKGKSEKFNIKVIFNKENLGFAKANNLGIKISSGKYIMLLNSDTIIKDQALKKMVEWGEGRTSLAGLSPLLLNPDGSPQLDYYMRFPNLWQAAFFHNVATRTIISRTFLRHKIFSPTKKEFFPVDQLPGAAMMAPRTVFEKTKGLDENFFFFFEDVDWCFRVRKMQLGQLGILPSASLVHLGGASWKKWLKNDRFAFYRQYFSSLLTFVRKHQPEKILFYRILLAISFLSNAFFHLVSFQHKKAITQLRLAKWILSA